MGAVRPSPFVTPAAKEVIVSNTDDGELNGSIMTDRVRPKYSEITPSHHHSLHHIFNTWIIDRHPQ